MIEQDLPGWLEQLSAEEAELLPCRPIPCRRKDGSEMTPKERAASLLLEELRTGTEGWWWISVANDDGFVGACIVSGRGPTDAWVRMHGLNLCPKDCSTQTMGPLLENETTRKMFVELGWRLLNKAELERVGLI